MLVYQTQFSINSEFTTKQLLDICTKWVYGSHYSNFNEKDFVNINNNFSIKNVEESVQIIQVENSTYDGIGFKYEKEGNNNDLWTTQIVGSKYNEDFKITVQLYWNSQIVSRKTPYVKRPLIVKHILDELGPGKDADLKVLDHAYYLEDKHLGFVDKIINGETSNVMPIVYISVQANDTPYVDPDIIANSLIGLAHVIVEPNREFSYKLMDISGGQNVYLGAVCIYWPAGMGNTRLFLGGKYDTPKDLGRDINSKVRDALISQQIQKEVKFSYLKDLSFKRKISELKEKGSTELEEYIESFDQEISSKDEEILKLESEVQHLKGLVSNLQNNSMIDPILEKGQEQELYPNEYKDFIISLLTHELQKSLDNTRKKTLLDNLLSVNQSSDYKEQFIDKLKSVFNNYRSLSGKDKQTLQELGFKIEEDGKHYKLIFKGDSRYQFSFAKTASDTRAGQNNVSTIKNKLLF